MRRVRWFPADPFGALVVAATVALLWFVLWLLWGADQTQAEWDAFVREHRCTRLSQQEKNSRPGWRCADGTIHYRWRQQL